MKSFRNQWRGVFLNPLPPKWALDEGLKRVSHGYKFNHFAIRRNISICINICGRSDWLWKWIIYEQIFIWIELHFPFENVVFKRLKPNLLTRFLAFCNQYQKVRTLINSDDPKGCPMVFLPDRTERPRNTRGNWKLVGGAFAGKQGAENSITCLRSLSN